MSEPSDSTYRVGLIIPALNEEATIGEVVRGFGRVSGSGGPKIEAIVVGDNGSRDRTAARAQAAGAQVVAAPTRGYGHACLAAMAWLEARPEGPPEVVVFADGDGSQDPEDLPALLEPLLVGEAEFVIGSRIARGTRGGLTPPQRYGNQLATTLLARLYGQKATDLGPFRAIRWDLLRRLRMVEGTYGWTVEMQIKAAQLGARTVEVEVANLPRAGGKSKVSGTVRGVVGAGYVILRTLFRHRGFERRGAVSADRIA